MSRTGSIVFINTRRLSAAICIRRKPFWTTWRKPAKTGESPCSIACLIPVHFLAARSRYDNLTLDSHQLRTGLAATIGLIFFILHDWRIRWASGPGRMFSTALRPTTCSCPRCPPARWESAMPWAPKIKSNSFQSRPRRWRDRQTRCAWRCHWIASYPCRCS